MYWVLPMFQTEFQSTHFRTGAREVRPSGPDRNIVLRGGPISTRLGDGILAAEKFYVKR